jgi:hypothetical protein
MDRHSGEEPGIEHGRLDEKKQFCVFKDLARSESGPFLFCIDAIRSEGPNTVEHQFPAILVMFAPLPLALTKTGKLQERRALVKLARGSLWVENLFESA